MGNPYPVEIQKGDARSPVTERGVLTFTDSGNQPGGATPATEGSNQGASTSVNNGATTNLPFGTSGVTLLDFTDPTAPTFKAKGVYAVTAVVEPFEPVTVGGYYSVALVADPSNNFWYGQVDSPISAAANTEMITTVTIVVAATAGMPLNVQLSNFDGVAAVHFKVLQELVTLIV